MTRIGQVHPGHSGQLQQIIYLPSGGKSKTSSHYMQSPSNSHSELSRCLFPSCRDTIVVIQRRLQPLSSSGHEIFSCLNAKCLQALCIVYK